MFVPESCELSCEVKREALTGVPIGSHPAAKESLTWTSTHFVLPWQNESIKHIRRTTACNGALSRVSVQSSVGHVVARFCMGAGRYPAWPC
jgi:hypothetical protein